jgi:hypothetical protein
VRPTFLVIGARKAGSTSLFEYLQAHPQVFMAPGKRLEFFSGQNWDKGLAWYEAQFAGAAGARAIGEASNSYTSYPMVPDTARRIADVLPDVKLVYLVRHPIERIVSQYKQHAAHFGETRTLDEVIRSRTGPYVALSRYGMQIGRYLECFPREQIHIAVSEALLADRRASLSAIYEFIGVDPDLMPAAAERTYHASSGHRRDRAVAHAIRRSPVQRVLRRLVPRPLRQAGWRAVSAPVAVEEQALELAPATRAELIARLRPDLLELRAVMGPGFDAWGLLDQEPAG